MQRLLDGSAMGATFPIRRASILENKGRIFVVFSAIQAAVICRPPPQRAHEKLVAAMFILPAGGWAEDELHDPLENVN